MHWFFIHFFTGRFWLFPSIGLFEASAVFSPPSYVTVSLGLFGDPLHSNIFPWSADFTANYSPSPYPQYNPTSRLFLILPIFFFLQRVVLFVVLRQPRLFPPPFGDAIRFELAS